MEENKQEYLSFIFDVKIPRNVRESTLNTSTLLFDELRNLIKQDDWTKYNTYKINNIIEKLKEELDNLKVNFEENSNE